MNAFTGYLAVFMGAGLGGAVRHAVNRAVFAWVGVDMPWATLCVNVTGSLALGLIAGWFAFRAQGGDQVLVLLLTTGFLGGYTTFSAFALDTVLLWERGQVWHAAGYVTLSVALSIAAALGGLALVRTAT
jgi:fluoride exporter